MSNFLSLRSVLVPQSVVHETRDFLRNMGQVHSEGFVLWVGRQNAESFYVQQAYVPEQTAFATESGVCVVVEAAELHRLNVWLYEHKLALLAQVHSHPTYAFHSDTDDAFPIATAVGSFSIVVPDFALDPISLPACAVFRLHPDGTWVQLTEEELTRFFTIVEE